MQSLRCAVAALRVGVPASGMFKAASGGAWDQASNGSSSTSSLPNQATATDRTRLQLAPASR